MVTLPISTATTKRSFSAIVKTRLRSKIEDNFLSNAIMIFIERKIAKNIVLMISLNTLKILRNVEFLLARNVFVKNISLILS